MISGERLKQAEALLGFLERIAKGAKNIAEIRKRIAKGAEAGDLDKVISWAHRRDSEVDDFIGGK